MVNPEHLEWLSEGIGAWNERWKDLRAQGVSADLRGANLREMNLSGVDFSGADLSEANLTATDLSLADLYDANLYGAYLYGAKLREANLEEANLREANFLGADLSKASLIDVDLSEAKLSHANFSGADLRRAYLDKVNLNSAYLTGANLDSARFMNASILGTKLIGANLMMADLTQANLTMADLTSANLCDATLIGADLTEANLREASLNGAILERATMIGTKLQGADLTGCRVYGISAWDVIVDQHTKQNNLFISQFGRSNVSVDNLKVAQFIYSLLTNPEIRDIIDTLTTKTVLILGRFTDERKAVLYAIRDALRARGFVPIVFDFKGPASRDLTETVSTLAHLSRFVIADLTDAKSLPQELSHIVPFLPSVPVQPLIVEGHREYAMFEHFARYPWVLAPYAYADVDGLLAVLEERVIAPAELKAIELSSARGSTP